MLLKQRNTCSADAVICIYAVRIKMPSACTALCLEGWGIIRNSNMNGPPTVSPKGIIGSCVKTMSGKQKDFYFPVQTVGQTGTR